MRLLTTVGPSKMKFSPLDDELYQSFRKEFPDFDVMNIQEEALRVNSISLIKILTCHFRTRRISSAGRPGATSTKIHSKTARLAV